MSPAPLQRLLYLHGFRSSPKSAKAVRMRAWLAAQRPDVQWWCPQLPPSPSDAMALIESGIAGWPRDGWAVVGSSLGGFYATVIAERHGVPAVLLNPAVWPARDLASYIGEQSSWHDPQDRFYFRSEYVEQLEAITPATISRPERYFTVIAKGDELLDWQEMTARYRGAPGKLLEGGDHALSDFDSHLPDIARFLGL